MAATGVKVKGLRELHRALKNADQETKKQLERELRDAGDIVRDRAGMKFGNPGLRTSTAGFGRVKVTRRRSRHLRGDFGSLLMRRSLLPALAETEPQVIEAVEGMLDRVGRKEGF